MSLHSSESPGGFGWGGGASSHLGLHDTTSRRVLESGDSSVGRSLTRSRIRVREVADQSRDRTVPTPFVFLALKISSSRLGFGLAPTENNSPRASTPMARRPQRPKATASDYPIFGALEKLDEPQREAYFSMVRKKLAEAEMEWESWRDDPNDPGETVCNIPLGDVPRHLLDVYHVAWDWMMVAIDWSSDQEMGLEALSPHADGAKFREMTEKLARKAEGWGSGSLPIHTAAHLLDLPEATEEQRRKAVMDAIPLVQRLISKVEAEIEAEASGLDKSGATERSSVAELPEEPPVETDRLVLDEDGFCASWQGKTCPIDEKTHLSLLRMLNREPGRIVKTADLLREALSDETESEFPLLYHHISSLRKTIRGLPGVKIVNKRGVGYRLVLSKTA